MNMKNWIEEIKSSSVKKAMPILSFPSIQLLNIGVKDLINNSDLQAEGMYRISQRVPSCASVSMMDLSVEAEEFGSEIRFSDDEVPTVIGHIVENNDQANALEVPKVGTKRTGLYINAIKKACELITDRPVFAGVIGPFSLSGRLLDVSEAMIYCYDDPDMVHTMLKKVSEFLKDYILSFKNAGANGVVVAEPLAGLLSPALNEEFSVQYLKQLIKDVQTDDFIVIYHNCGNNTIRQIDDILTINASAYHFGNAISIPEMLAVVPNDILIMGNIDPAQEFKNGTPESIKAATLDLLNKCKDYPNFLISSGCDIPPLSNWDNIDAFFETVTQFYSK